MKKTVVNFTKEQQEVIDEAVKQMVDVIAEAVAGGIEEKISTKKPSKKLDKKAVKDGEPDEEESEDAEEETTYTKKDLEAMQYSDLKALAKESGVSAKGTKKDLVDRILEAVSDEEEIEDEDEEESEEVEDKKGKNKKVVDIKKGAKKLGKKAEDEEKDEEEESEETEEAEEEETDDGLYEQVEAAVEDMDIKELKAYCKENEISDKGKRTALIAKLVEAVKAGKIDLEDDSEEESEDESEEDESFEDWLATFLDEMEGSKKRKSVAKKLSSKIAKQYDDEKLTDKTIVKFLKGYDEETAWDKEDAEDNLEEYIAVKCNLIDDDGKEHELSDAYQVGEDYYCCGEPLKEVDDQLVCEKCGESYEME
jgi:hypothetical protein